jgi:hypothetical protein
VHDNGRVVVACGVLLRGGGHGLAHWFEAGDKGLQASLYEMDSLTWFADTNLKVAPVWLSVGVIMKTTCMVRKNYILSGGGSVHNAQGLRVEKG